MAARKSKPKPEAVDYEADFGHSRALHHAKYWFNELDEEDRRAFIAFLDQIFDGEIPW